MVAATRSPRPRRRGPGAAVDLAAYPIPPGSVQRATAVRRSRVEEARRKAAQAAEHQRWKQERQALQEAARQRELEERQAEEAERSSNPGRWKMFGRWPASP